MMDSLEQFLRCAALLEADAANGYDRLAELMAKSGNEEVAELFTRFAGFSRLHLSEVHSIQKDKLGQTYEDELDSVTWPDGHSPENPLAVADLTDMTPRKAIETALETERRACDFYSVIAGQSRSDEVQEMAQEFAEEETEHVEHLERWLQNLGDKQ